jgi:hypothetical protein
MHALKNAQLVGQIRSSSWQADPVPAPRFWDPPLKKQGNRAKKQQGGGSPPCWPRFRSRASHPGTVGITVTEGLALGETGEGERRQFGHRLTRNKMAGNELADADHLIAMVGVGDHVAIVGDPVEDGDRIRREGADAAVAPLLELAAIVLEPVEQIGERRHVVVLEPGIGLVEVIGVAVRIEHRLGAHLDRDGAALDAAA